MTLLAPAQTDAWWRRISTRDRHALVAMIVVPVVLFVVPAFFGHPSIEGDNLIQNFPLRVLSGQQIASGHLPLFNSLANSGTPLLGGLNAGALYPLTVIFAFIPAIAAWLINCIAVYVVAATGMFSLLRWHGMRTMSSLAAAMSFAYTGAMIGQLVHLGVVQGFSFLPWTVLILLSLSRRLSLEPAATGWRRLAWISKPWICGYALLWGLTFLTGEPRGIADVELLTLIVGPSVLLLRTSYWITSWRARVFYVLALAIGLAWGLAVGLVQLLPGWSFIGVSQRATVNYNFFGAGSLVVRWTSLLLVPDLFGGNGSLGQPGFFAHYNLPEVTGYAGVLALMALFAFFTHVTRRGWKGPDRDYVLYVVIVVVGLFATWGYYTPLGHLFRAIPEYGDTRLQSRNIILVDLALSALLGWWFNQLEQRRTAEAGLESRTKWVVIAPAVAVAALCGAVCIWGSQIVHYFGVFPAQVQLAMDMRVSYLLHFAVAVAAILVVLNWSKLRNPMRIMMRILVVDIVLFLVLCATALAGSSAPSEPSAANARALLGETGRTALVDQGGAHAHQFQALGVPNMNVFTKLPSVQGYGSLEGTDYDDSTGTHPQTSLDPCRLADGTFAQLRLSVIAISYAQLGNNVDVPVPPQPNCRQAAPTSSADRYFGQILKVATVSVQGRGGQKIANGTVHFSLLDWNGRAVGPVLSANAAHSVTFTITGKTPRAAGFEVFSEGPVSIGNAVVTQTSASLPTYRLDSPYQEALDSRQWHLVDTVGTISIFKATVVRKSSWLETPSTGTITHIRNASWGDTWVTVKAKSSATIIRSVAYLPGWRAEALNNVTGTSMSIPVVQNHLIQRVTVPEGDWTIHFHYHAPYIEVSLSATIVGSVLMLGAGVYFFLEERRRRGDKVRS